MSLYNTLFGMNEETPVLLGMIGVNTEYFARFRDVDLINGGEMIRVMTRLGGANRQSYPKIWDRIRRHELYLGDYNDGFDNTYAYIEFKVPDKYKDTAKKMFKEEPIPFGKRFKKELEEMNIPSTEAYKRAEEIAKKFVNAINNDDGNFHIIKM